MTGQATWRGKRVLVTGAGGFIGSHLAERLVKEGARVRALVHYNANGSWGWLDDSSVKGDLEVVGGDICDFGSISDAMKGCEIVLHLAALIAIPYSYRAPESYVRTNVIGTLNVLQAARQHGISRLVHTSTSEVYGTARSVPLGEDHALQAQSPYSATKIGADKLVESFHLSFELPVVTARPFNTFGPRQSARAVVQTIITQCLTGSVVHLGNLSTTRDLNYVTNTVDGFLLAATAADAIGKTFNFGSGKEISIADLARKIAALCGKPDIEVKSEPERLRPVASEVHRLLADNGQAHKILKWQPAVSLEDGLSRTIEWTRSNLHRYRAQSYAI